MKQLETIRIFVGASQDQAIAYKCLKYTIEQHTQYPVEFRRVTNQDASNLYDPLKPTATGFSFGRLAIPKLAGYQGKAVYLDSDMLVYDDIAKLWDSPFKGAKVLYVDPQGAPLVGGRETAVLLMDCARLDWDVANIWKSEITSNPTKQSSQRQNKFISLRALLKSDEFKPGIESGWNDLDYKDDNTKLLHFTKMQTQPWVYAKHPLNNEWITVLKVLLEQAAVSKAEVLQAIEHKYIRPSLAYELGFKGHNPTYTREALHQIDKTAKYMPYSFLYAQQSKARQEHIIELKNSLTRCQWYKLQAKELYLKARMYLRHPKKIFSLD